MNSKIISDGVKNKGKGIGDFCSLVKLYLEYYFSNGTEVECQKILKNNNLEYTSLCIKEPGDNWAPSIPIEPYYEMYLNDKKLDDIFMAIIDCHKKNKVNLSFDASIFYNYEWVKEHIGFRIVNYEKNVERLKDMPYIRFLDLAIMAFVDVSDVMGVPSNFSVSNQHMDIWNIEGAQLLKDAVDNMVRIYPAELHTMSEVLDELSCGGCEKEEMVIPMHVLTNASKNWGAGCIMYPGILRTCIENVGKEFYILPSSVHEMILIPYDAVDDPEELIHMVRDVNKTEVPSFDILSDHIYKYDEATNVISTLDIEDCCEEGKRVIVCSEVDFSPFNGEGRLK